MNFSQDIRKVRSQLQEDYGAEGEDEEGDPPEVEGHLPVMPEGDEVDE